MIMQYVAFTLTGYQSLIHASMFLSLAPKENEFTYASIHMEYSYP